MLLSKGGVNWRATRARMPQYRAITRFLTRSRFVALVAAVVVIVILGGGLNSSSKDLQRFYCWGPAKSPMEMTTNEAAQWHQNMHTPVLFNHHAPIELEASTIQTVDLNPIVSTSKALLNEERVLILTPLRDAAEHLPKYFDLLCELTYPHHLIDLAFLVSDSTDDTLAVLSSELDRVQKRADKVAFHSALVVQKDFGAYASMKVEERHTFKGQGVRRKMIARARNYLLYSALQPNHSWVYWRDVDIQDSPSKILEDFMDHNKDIIVPNIWFHRYDNGRDIEGRCGCFSVFSPQNHISFLRPYFFFQNLDYNSWIESEHALKLAKTLDKDFIIAEGYDEIDTKRTYLVSKGDWRENKDVEVELDGVGGVNILVKADVHRSGINFPAYSFENQAETEGFAKMAKRAGYQVIGLPNYIVWHVDTAEKKSNLKSRKAFQGAKAWD